MRTLFDERNAATAASARTRALIGIPVRGMRSVVRFFGTTENPSWHSMIFFFVFFGLSRAVLNAVEVPVSAGASKVGALVCLPAALAVGAGFDRQASAATARPRVLSSSLSATAFLVTALRTDSARL